jgi:alpha-tubulin suppressor-like RCC1 family protein
MRKLSYRAKVSALTHSLLIAGLAVGCGGGDSSGPSSPTPVIPPTPFAAPLTTVAVGGSVQRRVFLGNQLQDATWKSADNAIATVTSNGVVTGVAPGKTTIEATAGSNKWSEEITVADLKFQQMVVGGRQTCALSDSGQWYCWGDNGVATLGRFDGPAEICQSQRRECSTTPRVPIGFSGFSKISISGGGLTCGLTAQGEVSCLGRNENHQYFGGSTEQCEVYSGADNVPNTFFTCSHSPVPISSQVRFTDVAAGSPVACGITADGSARCWGADLYGQLGVPASGTCDGIPCVPSPQSAVPNLTFRQLSVSTSTTCGITAENVGYCWGSNANGQRGADEPDGMAPNVISGGLVLQNLSVSSDHACGVTLAGDGYCWGSNVYGQLGSSTAPQSSTPLLVPGGLKWASITPGLLFTCGLTTAGAAYCWGDNTPGSLGDGTTQNRSTPAPVLGGHQFLQVQSGRQSTCGLTVDRRIYCWGSDVFGELGNGEQGGALFGAYFSTRPVGVGGLP